MFAIPPGDVPEPGAERILDFQSGDWSTPTAYQASVSRRGDLWTGQVGEERYEIPDAAIFGG